MNRKVGILRITCILLRSYINFLQNEILPLGYLEFKIIAREAYWLISLSLVSIFTGYIYMNHTRLEQLFAFLKEDPADPFNLYAIATEYLKTDIAQAMKYYEQLLQEHPDYVPTYYHAANLYAQVNNSTKARETFEKGLKVSLEQNNRHAHRELQSAYNQFLDDLEDE